MASFFPTLTPRHHTPDIGICLNYLDGTWGNFLLSHRACSPLQAPPVLANTNAKAHLLDIRPRGQNQDKHPFRLS
jgi:hypothetical protein